MKRLIILLTIALFSVAAANAQQTDEQVIQIIKECNDKGMGQEETLALLVSKGVTQDQIRRLKKQYDAGNTVIESTPTKEVETLRRQAMSEEMEADSLGAVVPDSSQSTVYGRSIFNNRRLTFAPNLNLPTPENYVLGPGDELNISLWGSTETNLSLLVKPEGQVNIPGVGPVSVTGLTIRQASVKLRNQLGKIYGGLNNGEAFMKLSLGNIRSIQVNVMGEIAIPGTYTLPSLATVFHALHVAGGVNDVGSLRDIRVMRNNKQAGTVDVYEFMLTGSKQGDIVLQDGDVVIVPPYHNLVELKGSVKRPMKYELKQGETLADLVRYGGDFTAQAYRNAINVVRQNERDLQVFNVESGQRDSFVMQDGDVATVGTMLARYNNKVEIQGAVYKEGTYAIDDTVRTVKQLVQAAEGVREDAFLDRVLLTREKEDWSPEMEAIDLGRLLRGEIPDITLRKNDVLYIPSKFDLQEEYQVEINGPIANPGKYAYAEGMTVEDLILQAGGLKESASTVKVDISRRIKSPKSKQYAPHRSKSFTISLKDGLRIDGEEGFLLEPYDQVYIRKSPIYNTQNSVGIEGEVVFEGVYPLAERLVRVSDVIDDAGGLTPYAFVEGARLERRMSNEERARINNILKILGQQVSDRDSLSLEQLNMEVETYPVGFDLTQALANPGSASDVIVQAGDKIIIPEYNGTVRIAGAVMYPNAVVFQEGKRLEDYIRLAGGFSTNARKKKVFVVYMNGMIETGRRAPIRPGCEIIVPMRVKGAGANFQEIMSVTSTTASLAAIVASLGALFK